MFKIHVFFRKILNKKTSILNKYVYVYRISEKNSVFEFCETTRRKMEKNHYNIHIHYSGVFNISKNMAKLISGQMLFRIT